MVKKKSSKTSVAKPNYFRTNLDKVREKYAEDGGNDKWWKPRDGKNVVRVCPPWGESADGSFYLKGGLHYGFSIGGRDRAIACYAISNRGKCPICFLIEMVKGGEEENYKDLIQRLRVRVKYWVNLIDRKNPNKVFMYGLSKKSWKLISGPMADEDDPIDATDPEEGYDMIIEKEGSGMQTRYSERMRPKPCPIEVEDWEEKLHDLSTEVLEWMKVSEMVKHLKSNFGDVIAELGIKFTEFGDKSKPARDEDDDEDDDDEDDEPKPKKKVMKKVAKKKAKDEDEDDDDDE